MKSITLLSSHYAAKWPTEGVHKTLEEVDQLGKQYAEHTDQDALLELCQCFHPYWMKYLVMICHGYGREPANHKPTRDGLTISPFSSPSSPMGA